MKDIHDWDTEEIPMVQPHLPNFEPYDHANREYAAQVLNLPIPLIKELEEFIAITQDNPEYLSDILRLQNPKGAIISIFVGFIQALATSPDGDIKYGTIAQASRALLQYLSAIDER